MHADVRDTPLYREIEDFWKASGEDSARFGPLLQDFGTDLLSRLVPESIQRALWQYWCRLIDPSRDRRDQSGNAKATHESPDFVPIFPPPAAMTTYCLPPTA